MMKCHEEDGQDNLDRKFQMRWDIGVAILWGIENKFTEMGDYSDRYLKEVRNVPMGILGT